MKRTVLLTAAALSLAAVPAFAQGNGHGNGKGPGFCPPGLAKKSPACVPPGQAKQYYRGDRIDTDYTWIRDPMSIGLDPAHAYVRTGGMIFEVDRDTMIIVSLIGAVSDIIR